MGIVDDAGIDPAEDFDRIDRPRHLALGDQGRPEHAPDHRRGRDPFALGNASDGAKAAEGVLFVLFCCCWSWLIELTPEAQAVSATSDGTRQEGEEGYRRRSPGTPSTAGASEAAPANQNPRI
jgi:hypothetical protein